MKRSFGHCGLSHLALVLSSLLTPAAFGQPGGSSGYGGGTNSSQGAIADMVKAAAFRERCVLLSTKFKHKGVEFQSKSGMGCIISTPQGQRILAMPLSMMMPVDVVQGNEKLSVACSMLLAAKVGDAGRSQESLAAFAERVDEMPMETPPKPLRKEPLLESELRIYRALDERCEVSFNGTRLSVVMKFFKDKYRVPIVLDESKLERVNLTPDEPITLELPAVSFRSALRLILNPLDLTFVIRNEVLLITSYEEAAKAEDPISHWNPVGRERESERKIFQALSNRDEVNFNGTPLSSVMKFFKENHQVPIVIYEKALEGVNITPDEPITLDLPAVSFRSALNLILEPLELTYVIENEVLLITSKAKALAEHPVPFIGANAKGVTAFGDKFAGMGGMGGPGMSGPQAIQFLFAPTQRYSSIQEARNADFAFSTSKGMTTANAQRQEYAAIQGPLAHSVDMTLGVAFVSLPGDFQAVPIPARVKPAGNRFVMLGQSWIEITQDRDSLAAVVNGSPVIDQQGESIGLFIDQKVVSLPELVQSLLSIDTKRLGYWGAETKGEAPEVTQQEKDLPLDPASTELNDELPELVTTELKRQIERFASLKGEGKDIAFSSIHTELDKRIQLRKVYAAGKLKSVQSKMERLTELSDRMNKQDMAKVIELLQGTPPPSQESREDDPFK